MITLNNLQYPDKKFEKDLLYNGQDNAATRLLLDKLLPLVEQDLCANFLYTFEMSLLAPALCIGMRGILFDEEKAFHLAKRLERESLRLKYFGRRYVTKYVSPYYTNFNFGSDDQLKNVLYGNKEVEPCEFCNWENRIVKNYPYSSLITDADGNYLRYKSGKNKNYIKHKEYKEHSKICSNKHIYPGLQLRPYKHRKTGEYTVDKEALGKLIHREGRYSVGGVCASIRLGYESRRKQQSFLRGYRNPDGYYPFTLNVGAARTLRFSSDSNIYGEGMNSQNIDKRIDKLTRPDINYIQCSRDLSNAENRALAAYIGDEQSLKDFESPFDSHSLTAQMCYPELDWPTDPVEHEKFARTTIINGKSIREASKITRHSVERFGTPHTVARNLKISVKAAEEIVNRIHNATPITTKNMAKWKYDLRYTDSVIVDVGIGQWAFPVTGNPYEDETAREMISDVLQSIVWFVCSVGFLNIWYELDEKFTRRGLRPFELLRQKHDELKYQIIENQFDYYDRRVEELMTVPLTFPNGLNLIIPTSAEYINHHGERM